MTKRAAIKRQTRETSREHGVLDSRQFMEDSKVRRLPTTRTATAGLVALSRPTTTGTRPI